MRDARPSHLPAPARVLEAPHDDAATTRAGARCSNNDRGISRMNRRKLVVGNWKMNGMRAHLDEVEAIGRVAAAHPAVEVGLCLPATLIMAGSERRGAAFPLAAAGANALPMVQSQLPLGPTQAPVLVTALLLVALPADSTGLTGLKTNAAVANGGQGGCRLHRGNPGGHGALRGKAAPLRPQRRGSRPLWTGNRNRRARWFWRCPRPGLCRAGNR